MRPLSCDLPKPLMPLWGEPLLRRLLRLLHAWGVRDVLVNCHHEPGAILEYARSSPVPGLRISLSFEPAILGTGGALRRAEWFLDDQPFWLVNADIAADLDPRPLLRRFAAGRCLAVLWMDAERGPRSVEMKRGFVKRFSGGTHTFCGLHLVSPRVLRYLPKDGFAGITPAYERAMRRGERIAGVCVPGSFWADLGAPQQYLDAHRDFARYARAHRTDVSVGHNVVIERGAQIENAVIWDGARIRRTARIRDAIIGRDVEVSGAVSHIVMRADRALDAAEQAALEDLRWNPAAASAQFLGVRGSARTFTRIQQGRRSLILMRYQLEREENALYARHARFLAGLGIRVPAILLDRPADRLCLVEDVGDDALDVFARNHSRQKMLNRYRRVLEPVRVLHDAGAGAARRARLPLMPPFSATLYEWERIFFAEHFLRNRLHLPEPRIRAILGDLKRVAAKLLRAPPVLIHRDLQSSNISWVRGRPVLMDFQGMRLGPAAYDLASLLADPYVMLDEKAQEELLADYADGANAKAIRDLFWPAVIERLAQALGAFARLAAIPGMEHFAGYIRPAWLMLRRALGHVEGLPALRRVDLC
jgi:N-acetylmuramate 1-kinase